MPTCSVGWPVFRLPLTLTKQAGKHGRLARLPSNVRWWLQGSWRSRASPPRISGTWPQALLWCSPAAAWCVSMTECVGSRCNGLRLLRAQGRNPTCVVGGGLSSSEPRRGCKRCAARRRRDPDNRYSSSMARKVAAGARLDAREQHYHRNDATKRYTSKQDRPLRRLERTYPAVVDHVGEH